MLNTASIKKGYHKAGKSFVLLFNRVSMYGPGHPFSVQAVEEFYQSISELLKTTSPVVLIYARDQFFLEDELLDRNFNYFKMSSHFKKAKVVSISIEKELQKREVEDFVKVFLDTRRYPSAEQMRSAAAALRVNHIKINHIFYQKVTEDDQVVAKSVAEKSERLSGELDSSRHYQEALGMIAGKLLMEELDQNISLKSLLADPAGFSHDMVARGLSAGPGQGAGDGPPGQPYSITGHLSALSSEIKQVLSGGAPVALSELAEALVKMKRELLSEIEAQKSLGIILDRDGEVRDQAEEHHRCGHPGAGSQGVRPRQNAGRTPCLCPAAHRAAARGPQAAAAQDQGLSRRRRHAAGGFFETDQAAGGGPADRGTRPGHPPGCGGDRR